MIIAVRALCHVVLVALLPAAAVLCGYFDSVFVETGLSHYAEKPFWGREDLLPSWLPMPANTIVNLGYVVVGLLWIATIRQKVPSKIDVNSAYMFYIFCWMSVLYGFVQSARILTQNSVFAILDQWYTLPIFVWIVIWSRHILYGWNGHLSLFIIFMSVSSYNLSLVFKWGFELALAGHILLAVFSAVAVYRHHPRPQMFSAFFGGLTCCMGFVCLKVVDEMLAQSSTFFMYFSGHFWSKIADFLQIHYACQFFLSSMEKHLIHSNKLPHEELKTR